MLVDDRSLGTCAAEGRAWREDELEILVRFLVSEVPFRDLQQAAELEHGGNASTERRLEHLLAQATESECAQTGLVGDAKQIVALRQAAHGAALTFGKPALGMLHETPAPSVGRGVANGAEGRHPAGGAKRLGSG